MKKRIVSSFILILILFSLFVPFLADTDEEFTAQDAADLQSAQDYLKNIAAQKKALQAEYNSLSSSKNSVMKSKQNLELQIEATEKEIDTLEWVINDLETKHSEKERELAAATAEYEEYYERYKARIRENYEMGDVTYLEVILTSTSLTEMLTRIDIISELIEYDSMLVDKMKENIAFITDLKANIEDNLANQQSAMTQLNVAKAEQAVQVNELSSKISYLDANMKDNMAEQSDFERLERELEQQINDLLDKKKKYAGGTFLWPLDTKWSKISSGYGWRTLYGQREFHYAIDIPADKGSPIYAAADGTIVYYGWTNTGGGNKVVLDHGSKLSTHYNHMSAYVPEFKEAFDRGETIEVKKGDIIGYVGSSGNSTGNHLDFKILVDGETVNPALYVTPDGSDPEKDIMDLLK